MLIQTWRSAAVTARLAIAVAHIAHIVLSWAVRLALAIAASRAIAAANVASIVAVRTVRDASTIEAGRVVATADVALIVRLAREANLDKVAVVRQKVFADAVVLERAGKRNDVHRPALLGRQIDFREAGQATQAVEVVDRPFEIRPRRRRLSVAIDDVRLDGVQHAGRDAVVRIGLPHKAILRLVERTTASLEEVQTEAVDAKLCAGNVDARKTIRLVGLLSRIADDEFHHAICSMRCVARAMFAKTKRTNEKLKYSHCNNSEQ
jgi:hypothetical protein